MQDQDVYVFPITKDLDHIRVRNWARRNGLMAKSIYDTRLNMKYIFRCTICGTFYNNENEFTDKYIDECQGRVYSRNYYCCKIADITFDEDGCINTNGIAYRIVPNAILVGPKIPQSKTRYKNKGKGIPSDDFLSKVPKERLSSICNDLIMDPSDDIAVLSCKEEEISIWSRICNIPCIKIVIPPIPKSYDPERKLSDIYILTHM